MQSAQMSQLRQDSIHLLREQAGRLKMQSKEIQLRDEQVRFLKETILALEQEKDNLASQNAQWKIKLKQMTAEITQYNTNVVQKIYEENQELLRQVSQLEQQLETVSQERQDALCRLRESEGRIQSHSSEKQQLSTVNQSLKEARSRHEKRAAMLQKENRDLHSKNIALQRQLDESSSQIAYCSQQIDVLTQKHHQALKLSEKRLKQTTEKMVPRDQFQRVEREAKDSIARNKQLRADCDRLIKDQERLKFELAACKDRLLTAQIREETRSQQLRIDLANLSQSIKIGKRVAQFQSDQHQTFSAIYEVFRQLSDRNIVQQQQVKSYAQRVKETEIERHALGEELRFRQVQMQQLRQTKAEQEQAREAQYEHRLMQLGLRLKREEIALAGLRQKEDQLQNIREQREKQLDQHRIQSEAMARTIDELRKENFKLGEELSSAIRLCEQNLMGRECVSYFKYVVQDLVGIIYYLHLHLIRSHERTLKLYQPFLNYYIAIHPAITHKDYKRPINRFRTAVYAVIAMGRMRRQRGKGKGLQWYAVAAGQRRQKFENMAQHIEALSSTVLNGGKALDVLRKSENTYKWRISNYMKVKLPISDDRKIISQSEIELDLNY